MSKGADKENLLNNQELIKLVIISFNVVTEMFESGVYCKGKLDASHSKGLIPRPHSKTNYFLTETK